MLAGRKSPKQYTEWYVEERGTMSGTALPLGHPAGPGAETTRAAYQWHHSVSPPEARQVLCRSYVEWPGPCSLGKSPPKQGCHYH